MTTEQQATAVGAEPTAASPSRISWGELALSLALIAIGIITIVDGVNQPESTSASHIGAGLFPIIVGTIMIVAAALLAVQVLRRKRGEADDAEGDVDVTRVNWWQALVVVAAIVWFIVTLDALGYVISAAVTFAGIAVAMGARRWITTTIVAIALSLGVFYLFTLVLQIRLPAGILTGIL